MLRNTVVAKSHRNQMFQVQIEFAWIYFFQVHLRLPSIPYMKAYLSLSVPLTLICMQSFKMERVIMYHAELLINISIRLESGVVLGPCFSKILARTTFVLIFLPEAKNTSQDAILRNFVFGSSELMIIQSINL